MTHAHNHARNDGPLQEPQTHKTCTRCRQSKPLAEFGKNASQPDGKHYWCKACANAYMAARYVPRPRQTLSLEERATRRQNATRRYREGNLEQLRVTERERQRRYRQANPEAVAEKRREYYVKNRERELEQQRQRRAEKRAERAKEPRPPRPVPEPKPALILDPALQKAIDAFLNVKALKSARTQTWYETSIRLFCEHLIEAGLEQWPADVETLADNINSFTAACQRRGLKDESISGYLRALTSWLKWLAKRKRIPAGLGELIEWPERIRPLPKAAKPEDVAKMMSLLEQSSNERWQNLRDYALLTLALDTGARIGELASLTLPALDMKQRNFQARGTKTNTDRTIVFSPAAAVILQAWLNKRAELDLPADLLAVFVSEPKGLPWQPLTDSGMRQVLKRWQNRAEITRFNFHSLRHSYAVYSLRAKADLTDIQRQLGHSTVTTTARYLLVDDAGRAGRHDLANPLAYLLKQAQEAARQEAA